MKSFTTTTLLLAAGAASTVYAEHANHARHKDLHERQLPAYMAKPHPPPAGASSCGCYSYTTTWYGAPTFVPDTRDYGNTTSAGWATIAPEATAASTVASLNQTESVASSTSMSSLAETESATTSTSLSLPAETDSSATSSTSSIAETYPANRLEWGSRPGPSNRPEWGRKGVAHNHAFNPENIEAYSAPPAYVAKASISSSLTAEASSYASPSSTSTSSTASASSTTVNSTITPNGDKWAFCYTPYASDGTCKTADAIAADVAGIKAKGFTSIRLYATDCEGPQNVGAAAAKQGLKLILGIWVDESGIGSNTDAQIETLTNWGQKQWDLVEMVVAGNEAMFYGYTTAEGLAAFVHDVRSKFRAAGYSGPVGTSEVPGTFIGHADVLCPAVDYAGANIHPFFSSDVSAEDAGDFVVEQLDKVAKACGYEKEAYNLESGWPSLGSANGMAVPGAADQKVAIKSITEKAGNKTAMFSYANDAWKAPGEFGVEQHWGCAELFDDDE